MAKIRGKFKYHSEKKKKNKELDELKNKKLQRKEDKKLRKKCECNHLDAEKGKVHMKTVEVGEGDAAVKYNKCKICGGMLIADDNLLTEHIVENAVNVIYTVYGLIRNKFDVKPQVDKDISTTLFMNARAVTLLEKLKSLDAPKKGKNKNKKKKNKSKKYKRFNY